MLYYTCKSNTNVKGRVVQVKKYFMMLVMVLVMTMGFSVSAQASTTTINVTNSSTTTLKKIDKQLKKGKKFYLNVKGNKTSSKKLIKKVAQSIGKTNGYSVRFNYSGQKKSSKKGYYRFTVSQDNAKLYTTTIKLIKDMYENHVFTAIWTETELVKADDYDISFSTYYDEVEHEKDVTYKERFNNKKFCQLTTLQQSRVITALFGDYITYGKPYDIQENRSKYSDAQLMKRLLDKKATGVCGDYTLYQMLIFDQIGIESHYYYSNEANHAYVIFNVKNASGKSLWIGSNYGDFKQVKFTSSIANDWTVRDVSSKKMKEIKSNSMSITKADVEEALVSGWIGFDSVGFN
jgi:hypothetical protein